MKLEELEIVEIWHKNEEPRNKHIVSGIEMLIDLYRLH